MTTYVVMSKRKDEDGELVDFEESRRSGSDDNLRALHAAQQDVQLLAEICGRKAWIV